MELPKANPTACRLGIREKQVEVKDPQPAGWGFRTVSLRGVLKDGAIKAAGFLVSQHIRIDKALAGSLGSV